MILFLSQDKHHFHSVMRITAYTVNKSNSTMQVFINTRTYFFIFTGDNKELNRLTGTVYHLVQYKTGNKEHHISIDDFPPSYATLGNLKK